MHNAVETTRAVSVTAASNATTSVSVATADPDLFAKELRGKMPEGTDAIASVLEHMAADFPGAAVTVRDIGGFAEARAHYSSATANFSINLDRDVLDRMAEDGEFYAEVRELAGRLFEAGQRQNLVDAGGVSVARNVSVTAAGVRYVEVQRGVNGAQLSVSSLAAQADKTIADLIAELIETILANRGGSTFGGGDSFGSGASGSSSGSSSPFDWMMESGSWRFESYLTAAGSASSAFQRVAGQQIIQQRQALELTVSQWSASGGAVDLVSYMEIMGLCDPLALDLGGEGIRLSSAEDGVYFDIRGDGSPVRTAFIQGNTAFLYLDGNGNGVVDDVSELFGDYGGHVNGFESLARYDGNGDGVIDADDGIYRDLRVWRDLNGDGINQVGESMSLAEAGVASINLDYSDGKTLDRYGNVFGERSTFTRSDGSNGEIVDVWLRNIGS